MSKHTPGPWIADNFNIDGDFAVSIWQYDGRPDYYHRTKQIGECFFERSQDIMDEDGTRVATPGEAEANAKLIAASPSLRDLLAQIVHEYDQTYDAESISNGNWIAAASIPVHVMQQAKRLLATIS